MEPILMGFLTATAFFILMWKIDINFFTKYQWQSDVAVSAGLMFLFYGTFEGMLTSVMAGIFMSIFLYITGKFKMRNY